MKISQIMIVDFEQTEILNSWAVLKIISSNQKRKWVVKRNVNKLLKKDYDKFVQKDTADNSRTQLMSEISS
jgi:hypothetical protein